MAEVAIEGRFHTINVKYKMNENGIRPIHERVTDNDNRNISHYETFVVKRFNDVW